MTRAAGLLPILLIFLVFAIVADLSAEDLAESLSRVEPRVLSGDEREAGPAIFRQRLSERLRAANRQSSEEWRRLKLREDWEAFRRPKLLALIRTLGPSAAARLPMDSELRPAEPRQKMGRVEVTGRVAGAGYRIENLLMEALPDYWITANLYLPESPPAVGQARMPGFVICHSHHSAKTSGELQDMGQLWARAGCAVLVMDQIGYGERRIHPFASAEDYPQPFALGRQSYYFRYDLGIQLHLAGESLMGMMAGDLISGVSYLIGRSDVDPQRIILLGSVAGGGDPAAVAGALDPRIAVVGPFNFGGPQPETKYPLPDDAEESFNYAGGGSWESTRNLRESAAEGFLPWVIVGSIAPRGLIYGHEFSWDGARDPVWKRLETIYGWYGAPDKLGVAHGRGTLQGQAPASSHCSHIGRVHRQMIHPLLARWCAIKEVVDDGSTQTHEAQELQCWTDEARARLKPPALVERQARRTVELSAAAQQRILNDRSIRRPATLWSDLVAPADTRPKPMAQAVGEAESQVEGIRVRRFALRQESEVPVPLLLLEPAAGNAARRPVVLGIAQEGKAVFLPQRSREIAALLQAGVSVCLADLRGTGETGSKDQDRDQYSEATSWSASAWMTGRPLLAQRLEDVGAVLDWLAARSDVDAERIGLWAESFAEANPPETQFLAPRRISGRPRNAEPMSGAVALLAGVLHRDKVAAVYVHGGLVSYADVMRSPCVYIPHDAQIPDVFARGDLPGLAGQLAGAGTRPLPLCLSGLVDGYNRRASVEQVREAYAAAIAAYRRSKGEAALTIAVEPPPPAIWFAEAWKR